MHKGKNAKYVIDFPKPHAKYPPYRVKNDPNIVKLAVQVDADTLPESKFYAEMKWILPGAGKEIKLCESHTHEFDEMLGFFGFNYDNIQDLGAEIEITIGHEKSIVDRCFAALIPAGMQHGPLIIRNIKRPIIHASSGPSAQYK